jgi:hypothetical protein
LDCITNGGRREATCTTEYVGKWLGFMNVFAIRRITSGIDMVVFTRCWAILLNFAGHNKIVMRAFSVLDRVIDAGMY